ncbi:unnamed protein product, partial [Sphacelaria rigidula]
EESPNQTASATVEGQSNNPPTHLAPVKKYSGTNKKSGKSYMGRSGQPKTTGGEGDGNGGSGQFKELSEGECSDDESERDEQDNDEDNDGTAPVSTVDSQVPTAST